MSATDCAEAIVCGMSASNVNQPLIVIVYGYLCKFNKQRNTNVLTCFFSLIVPFLS